MNEMAPRTIDTRFRDPGFVPPRLRWERRPDGSILLENLNPVREAPRDAIAPLERWAVEAPDRIMLAQRTPDGSAWETVTYAQGWARIRALAQGMIDLGLGPDRPLMILSRNSVDHALLTYAAMLARAPACPVSMAYSLMASDFERVRYVADLIEPGAVFAEPAPLYARAMAALARPGLSFLTAGGKAEGIESIDLETLAATVPGPAVDERRAAITPDDTAKYLLTSGSTGRPKAVINTHRTMSVNAAMVRSMRTEESLAEPPVMISFLPWSHTMGANSQLNETIVAGGSFYIDHGAPVPGRFEETIRNLREVTPTNFSTVPVGWAMLANEFERDPAFAAHVLAKLRFLAYGGAGLSQNIYDRIQAVAEKTIGARIAMMTGYGATETGPTVCTVSWVNERMGIVGLPLPGVVMKLARVGEKLESRVRGACVMPAYYRDEARTTAAFDEEGFYRFGDAVKLVDPEDPAQGLFFDGRLVENFKLNSGTFVSAGPLRIDLVAAMGGLAQDAIICGENEGFIAILVFLNAGNAAKIAGGAGDLATLAANDAVRAAIAQSLKDHNAANRSSSHRVVRALIMTNAPSVDDGEITEKGYINQARAREFRAGDVARLFAETPDDGVLILA